MASTTVTVCIVLLTLGVWLALGCIAAAAFQVLRTARALESLAQRARVELLAHEALETLKQARETLSGLRQTAEAVEVFAHQANETVSGIHGASSRIGDFARSVSTGWLRALGLTLGAVTTLWSRRKNEDAGSDHSES